ncbi:MAG: immunogenic protein [Nitriliruptor sp.]|nr:MAG: immunogenic protein [Nitriliruptor sp.]TVR27071.1 MAG: immunogenic protein [Nitriliruptor sp.]
MHIWSRGTAWLSVPIATFALLLAACDAADIADDPQTGDAVVDVTDDGEEATAEEEAATGERISMRWATSDVGSYGYAVASFMVDFLNRELPSEYVVTVHPYPSTTAAKKAAMDGEAEISYTADVGMVEYFGRSGPYEGFEPEVGDLVHTFYAYPMETFLLTTEDLADEYGSYADFDGEPVYFTPAGFMNWLNLHRIFDALGYENNHVEIDSAAVADSMQGGTIVGAGSYTTAGASLPTWWREAELRVDLQAIEFTADELAALDAAGLSVSEIDPSVAFSQDLGVDMIQGVPILFGYNVRADIDEAFVYDMLTIFEDNMESLLTLDGGFGPLADDFVGTQAGGIRAAPDIPVHPGLARFLEERDAWDDAWTIAG